MTTVISLASRRAGTKPAQCRASIPAACNDCRDNFPLPSGPLDFFDARVVQGYTERRTACSRCPEAAKPCLAGAPAPSTATATDSVQLIQLHAEAHNALAMALHYMRQPAANVPGAARKAVQALAALRRLDGAQGGAA